MRDDADILVGADGIHSAVRRHLYPRKANRNSQARFCGVRQSKQSLFLTAGPSSLPDISISGSSPTQSLRAAIKAGF